MKQYCFGRLKSKLMRASSSLIILILTTIMMALIPLTSCSKKDEGLIAPSPPATEKKKYTIGYSWSISGASEYEIIYTGDSLKGIIDHRMSGSAQVTLHSGNRFQLSVYGASPQNHRLFLKGTVTIDGKKFDELVEDNPGSPYGPIRHTLLLFGLLE